MIRNAGRLLRITNAYHLLTGTAVHRYSALFGQFRLSYWACINLALGHLLYWACLYTHYVHADQVHLVRYFSELLHDCIYAHLFVGILTYAIVAIEYRRYVAFSVRVSDTLHANAGFLRRQRAASSAAGADDETATPTAAAAAAQGTLIARWWKELRCDGLELFVYYKMWVNTVVLLALSAYSLYLIDLRALTRVKVMLIVALAYPHVLVANVLRFYTVHAMIVNAMWADENAALERTAAAERDDGKPSCCVALDAAFGPSQLPQRQPADRVTALREHFANIDLYRRLYADLNRLLQLQVGLLLKKHALIVFIAVHVYVKLRLLWHAVLSEVDQHLIRVNFVTFFVMMLNDYVCLLVVSQVCQREADRTKRMLLAWLDSTRHEETLRAVWTYIVSLKDYKYGGMRVMMLFRVNGRNFVMVREWFGWGLGNAICSMSFRVFFVPQMLSLQLLTVGIIGTFQYLNTRIDEEL